MFGSNRGMFPPKRTYVSRHGNDRRLIGVSPSAKVIRPAAIKCASAN